MGANNSQQHQSMVHRFRSIGSVELYHFGKVDLFYDQLTHQEVIRTTYQFLLDKDSQEQFVIQLKHNNNKCPYLINIHKIQVQPKSSCSGSNLYHVYFEYIPMTLNKFIQINTASLPERQVRLLMGCLLQAVKEMNQRQTYHGDIFPQFIYLDERGPRKYKIFDSAYFDPLRHGYYRAFDEASFCSPEILANVAQRKTFPLYNFYISDTFSIGMIALYAMTKINPIIAYSNNSRQKQIDYYYIQNLLRIACKKNYSQYLINCVEECVRLKDRPHASQILDRYPQLQVIHGAKLSLRR